MPALGEFEQSRTMVGRVGPTFDVASSDKPLRELSGGLSGVQGVSHRPDYEEVILLLSGRLGVTLDGDRKTAEGGAVIHVPAGSEFRVDGGPAGASA